MRRHDPSGYLYFGGNGMIPVLTKKDFSIFRLRRIVRGYYRCAKKIGRAEIGRDTSFRMYSGAGMFLGNSTWQIIMPVSMNDALRIAPFLLRLEDRRFYQHKGVDFYAVMRAVARNIQRNAIVQGGSTITMQLVRNTLIESQKSFLRKFVEMMLAMKMDDALSKNEILRLYCEQVFLGERLYGFQSAAYFIYRRPLSKLTDEEIIGLLGMLRTPQRTNPLCSASAYEDRQAFVLRVMKKDDAGTRKIRAVNPIRATIPAYPRMARTVIRELGEGALKRVEITLDMRLQKRVETLISEASKDASISTASALIVDNETGEIRAESAWRQGREMEFSPILEGKIQPGSTFKLFALIAAMEQGLDLNRFKLLSAPYTSVRGRAAWNVRNYGGVYRGEISLRRAFVNSDNTVFARLTDILDMPHLISVYRRFDLLPENEYVFPSIVLGATKNGISATKLLAAYQSVANNGVGFSDVNLIRYAEFHNGDLSWRNARPSYGDKHVISSEHIPPIKEVLGAAAYSYGVNCLGAKTGTTSAERVIVAVGNKITCLMHVGRRFFYIDNHETNKTVPLIPRIINKLVD